MNWREMLHIDLGSLLRGKVEVRPPLRTIKSSRPFFGVLGEFFLVPVRWCVALFGLLRPMRQFQRIIVTEQLARIVACNMPLVPAIEAIMVDVPYRRARAVLYRLRTDLAQGASLAEAMRRQPRFFPKYYVDLVQAGEQTGALYPTLCGLAETLSASLRVRDSVRLAGLYFGMMLIAGGSLASFIMVYVMPVFMDVWRDFGVQAPAPVRLLTALASFLKFHWPEILLTIGVGGTLIAVVYRVAARLDRKKRRLGLAWDRLMSGIPFIRTVIAQASLAHAGSILAGLLRAGYPVDEALESTSSADIRPLFAAALCRLRDRVRQGEALAQAVERETWVLPASFRGMASIGESSGRLPEALERLAHLYHRQVLKVTKVTLSTLFPFGVIALGCCVMWIYSSVFLMLVGLIDSIMP
jgi:type IV pilus assembly protein PilC